MSKNLNCKQASLIPSGLKALIDECQNLYPTQTNPLQISTVLKYWLGGDDPLDYISMYHNKGDKDLEIPEHWHYISFGLSDLHGDGRVHTLDNGKPNEISGMGFELTFRLKITPETASRPPTWPAHLLQGIARYCFQTGNRLFPGDYIPWRKSLDGLNSKLKNVIICIDPQLDSTNTPFGSVDFCQIVGVADEELEEASHSNSNQVANYLRREPSVSGPWLITDIERSQSIFELFPEILVELKDKLEKEGSDLAGVNAEFSFIEICPTDVKIEVPSEPNIVDDFYAMTIKNSSEIALQQSPLTKTLKRRHPKGLELTFPAYAIKYLLIAVKDRIRHGRHFTFKGQNFALTFVAETVTGSFVSKTLPYGILGYWIQVLIPEDLIPQMIQDFNTYPSEKPKETTFDWAEQQLKITISGK